MLKKTVLYDAPHFVKYYQKHSWIKISPNLKGDVGFYKVLLRQVINSQDQLSLLLIVVQFPLTFVDESIVPFFEPALKDERKIWGVEWIQNLPTIQDPAGKYTYVKRVQIVPDLANDFVKYSSSSNRWANSTRIL